MDRRIFRTFKYTECDDFAAFLNKMSKEGWHFKGWKLGLIFEQGTPEDVEYSVEIFINGTEWDVRPDADTEEFAEYCMAAGWKFIDSNKKFVVFKKISDDAVEIVSPEEHLRNASKAEMKGSALQCVGWILITAFNLFKSFTDSFYYDVFSYSILVIVSVFIILILKTMYDVIHEAVCYRKRRTRIVCGEKVYLGIGDEKQLKRYWRENLFAPVLILLIAITVFFEIGIKPMISVLIGIIVLTFSLWVIEYLRPVRAEYVLATFAVSIFIPILMILYIFLQPEDEILYTDKNVAPLLIEDYREPECTFESIEIDHASDLFGSYTQYSVNYHDISENPESDKWDTIRYLMIESKYDWILDHSWKTYTKDISEFEECSDDWQAEYAIRIPNWWASYCVRYDNYIFILEFENPTLTQEQIDIIRKQMGLGQVM